MGICYVLTCEDCKRRIDLDKNRAVADLMNDVLPRENYPWMWPGVEKSFRFLRRHWGHKVDLVYSEGDGPEYGRAFTYQEEFGK